MTATWSATMWLNDIDEEDHSQTGLNRLIAQYRGEHPRIQALLDAFLSEVQNFDDVTFEVLTGMWPLTAVGVQLDNLGDIVGQLRGELVDEAYRIFILARILANKSKGKTPDLIEICEVVGAIGIQIDESWPAGIVISVGGVDYGWILGEIMADASPGGVYLHWSWTSHIDDDAFMTGDTLGTDETNVNGGFGDLTGATQTSGGYMTGGSRL